MYIISNVNSDAGLMDGHAWIRLESRKGESTTMSLWGNRGKQEFWMNLEINGGYGAAKKFSPITPSQYNLIINYNLNPSNINWTPWNTCAGYSAGLWNYVNGDNLSATDYFWFTTPRSSGYISRIANAGDDLQSSPFSQGFVIPILTKRSCPQGWLLFKLTLLLRICPQVCSGW